MRLSGQNSDSMPAISLTPLIDVVFILLIFFMLASSFLDWRELPIQGQESKSSASVARSSDTEILRLSLFRDGNIGLNGKAVSLSRLEQDVSGRSAPPREIRVFVAVEDGVPVQTTLDFLDQLKALGLSDMTLRDLRKP